MLLARESHQYYHQYEEKRDNIRKVRKIRRYKNSSRALYAAVLMLSFLTFLMLTTRYAQITAAGYEIVEMKKALQGMEAENQELEMKIAQLQSLDRIEALALGKLGMVKPDNSEGVQFIAVESKGAPENDSGGVEGPVEHPATASEKEQEKPVAVIDALSKLLADWTGKTAQAEAHTVTE